VQDRANATPCRDVAHHVRAGAVPPRASAATLGVRAASTPPRRSAFPRQARTLGRRGNPCPPRTTPRNARTSYAAHLTALPAPPYDAVAAVRFWRARESRRSGRPPYKCQAQLVSSQGASPLLRAPPPVTMVAAR
jgi:hypothetical protein